ncbi:hypothetical protein LX15_002326 [Streptoalloteichus tenebrarius]|uniref:YggT family protein n=1 Tax=Streptoalloteichus tenebrarius (strain ATCC 17920 / DSM 40477 / JCM 4838 / CBS 697.72 / NBRC 16177 / NCIMB 11028 / NRRL B-12390 / A12253. 1 / ISP 5477) TaxID=1933 RepID=A0ABT1HSY2_STRSD|nr:hypothetical protein [Streptoalloteichus tenebrarius]MCP2258628.1 hypothetical protein [Streptoalloteichus tenebrarius]BFF04000.1 hypothetical protein GCM10020241_56750 [Streptoalloteichus tenebrarius]
MYVIDALFAFSMAAWFGSATVSFVLIWVLLAENLLIAVPGGDQIRPWFLFTAQAHFLGQAGQGFPYPPLVGLACAARIALLLAIESTCSSRTTFEARANKSS